MNRDKFDTRKSTIKKGAKVSQIIYGPVKWEELSERERMLMLSISFQAGGAEGREIVTDRDVMRVCSLPEELYCETKRSLIGKGLINPVQDCFGIKLMQRVYPIRYPDPYFAGW